MSPRRILPAMLMVLLAGGAFAEEAKPDPAFDKLFGEGLQFMREGKAHEAIIVFEAARKRQPRVAEVSANLGFIRLAQKDFPGAQRDFERALTVQPQQVNAYWGLAMAAHDQGDLDLALGAMRTFEHLEKEDSPFQRKAAAAIWEWEEELRLKQGGKPMEIPPGAVRVDDKKPVSTYDDLRKDKEGRK